MLAKEIAEAQALVDAFKERTPLAALEIEWMPSGKRRISSGQIASRKVDEFKEWLETT